MVMGFDSRQIGLSVFALVRVKGLGLELGLGLSLGLDERLGLF